MERHPTKAIRDLREVSKFSSPRQHVTSMKLPKLPSSRLKVKVHDCGEGTDDGRNGFAQARAICVQIAYRRKPSLSGDFKNAHRSPAVKG